VSNTNDLSRRVPARVWAILLAVASVYPLAIALLYQNTINDDAFITLTYARCLAEGKGFVFGFPPATLGTTAPLLAMLMALVMTLVPWVAAETLLLVVSALFWIGGAWVVFLLRRAFRLSDAEACVVGLIYLAGGVPQWIGMESNLYFFLALLAVGLFVSGRWLACGVVAAALALARTEGAILVPMLCAWLGATALWTRGPWRETVQNGAKLLLGAALVWGPWAIYAFMTFGHVLPQTGEVKVLQGQAAGRVLFGSDLVPFLLRFQGTVGYPYWLHYGVAVVGLFVAARRGGAWWILLSWLVAYIAGFSFMRVAMYPWYAAPVQYGINLASGVGLAGGLGLLLKSRLSSRAATGLCSLLVVAFAAVLAVPSARQATQVDTAGHFPQRWRAYKAAAAWLRENTPEGSGFACLDVGYMGYYAHNRILDLSGLVTPEQVPWLRRGDKTGLFYERLPDYCMFWRSETRRDHAVIADPRFVERYVARTTFPISDGVLTVYQRK
jgi:hypothetical protein